METKPGMELFFGDESTESVNWVAVDRPIKTKAEVKNTYKLDRDELDNIKINKVLAVKAPEFHVSLKAIKNNRKEPREPSMPDKSKITNVPSKYKSFLQKIILSKKAKERLIEEYYQDKLAAYNKRYKKYEESLAEFNEKYPKFLQKKEDWIIEANARFDSIDQYYLKMIRYNDYNRANRALKKFQNKQNLDSIHTRYNPTSIFQSLYYKESPLPLVQRKYLIQKAFGKENPMLKDFEERIKTEITYNNVFESYNEVMQQLTELEIDKNLVSPEAASRYLFSFSSLGWINCDRFVDVPQEHFVDINFDPDINLDETWEQQNFIVFNDINSVLTLRDIDECNIPKGKHVSVLSLVFKEGEFYLAKKDFISGNNTVALKYQSSDVKNLRDIIKEMT